MSINPRNGHEDGCPCVNCDAQRREAYMRGSAWSTGGMNDNLVKADGSDGLPIMIAQCPVRHKAIAAQIVREHNAHADLVAALQGLLEWGRNETGPTDYNSPHELLVAAAKALAKVEP